MARPIEVALEAGTRRVFAFALNWPGWCRSGRDEARALEALAAAAPRYARVAGRAGAVFPGAEGGFAIVERLTGSTTTDFGAPAAVAAADHWALTAAGAKRLAALVEAADAEFDEVAAAAPAELRKGPRGGGRERDAIVAHTVAAAAAYARCLGLRPARVDPADPESVAALRRAMGSVLRSARGSEPVAGSRWLPRFAARRLAWHALDHAWEMEDRAG